MFSFLPQVLLDAVPLEVEMLDSLKADLRTYRRHEGGRLGGRVGAVGWGRGREMKYEGGAWGLRSKRGRGDKRAGGESWGDWLG